MATVMDVDPKTESSSTVVTTGDKKPRFEVKKVGYWLPHSRQQSFITGPADSSARSGMPSLSGRGVCWPLWVHLSKLIYLDIVVDNCAICRNHIMDLCQ